MTSLPGAFLGGIFIGLIEAFANADHSFVPGLNSLPTAQAEVAVAVVLLRDPAGPAPRPARAGGLMAADTQLAPPDLLEQLDLHARRRRTSLLGWLGRAAGFAPVLLLVLLVPAHSGDWTNNAIFAAIYAMVGLSMNVLVGYTGQISLGQQAFLGIGALTAANVVHTGTNSPDPFTFALGHGRRGRRLRWRGSVARRHRAAHPRPLPGAGDVGVRRGDRGRHLHDPRAQRQRCGRVGLPARRRCSPTTPTTCSRSRWSACASTSTSGSAGRKIGRGLIALRDNELVASAFGINVLGYKLLGFVLSGAMAGLAGVCSRSGRRSSPTRTSQQPQASTRR